MKSKSISKILVDNILYICLLIMIVYTILYLNVTKFTSEE